MTQPLDERAMALQAVVAGTISLEAELGRGGMGVVYLAREVALDRPVAVKLLHSQLAMDPDARTRFLAEARTGARLAHPNIVPIYDVGEHDDLVWFVMGYVEGESLADRLHREGPLPSRDVERVLQEIGWALATAHAAGVLHRDVTLANILLERHTGRALLADFGLAEHIDGVQSGTLVGTPEYLAPELIHGAAPAPASDLYALGVVGWALCTGRLPVTAPTAADTLLARLQGEPPPLIEAAPGVPRSLRMVIEAAMATDPASRPPSVEAWLAGANTTTAGTSLAPPLARWIQTSAAARPFYALGMSAVGVLLVASENGLGQFVGRYDGLGIVLMMALAAGLGAIVQVALAVSATRRAAMAGYTVADLQVALRNTVRERLARGTVAAPLFGRVVNDLAWLAGLSALTWSLLGRGALEFFFDQRTVWGLLALVQGAMHWFWLAFFGGLAFNFIVPATDDQPRNWRWRLRQAFWNSALARGFFAVASFGRRTEEATPNTLHRPTEVMLQVGISELHHALPAPQRRALSEVPEIANRLQQRIGEVRERIALLEGPGGARSAEAGALRERLVGVRDEAISALERLRRELMRLGSQIATTGPLSEQLRALRAVDQQLLTALQSLP